MLLFLLTRPNLLLFGVYRENRRLKKTGGQVASTISFTHNPAIYNSTAQRNLINRRTRDSEMEVEHPDDSEEEMSQAHGTARDAYPMPQWPIPPSPPQQLDIREFAKTPSERLATEYRGMNADMRPSEDSGVAMLGPRRSGSTLSPSRPQFPVMEPPNPSPANSMMHGAPSLTSLEPAYGPSSRIPPLTVSPPSPSLPSGPDIGARREGDDRV